MKKIRDGGEKDNGCFIALVPNKTLILILLLLLLLLLLLFCVKFESHGWYLKWKEGIWISEKKKKKKNPLMTVEVYTGFNRQNLGIVS